VVTLADVENDVDHDEANQERYLDTANHVLNATVDFDGKQVDEEGEKQEETDPDARIRVDTGRPRDCRIRVLVVAKIFWGYFKFEDLSDCQQFSNNNTNISKPVGRD